MYLLEFGGEDDRFSLAEAAMVTEDAVLAAPGVGVAERIDERRCRYLARTRAVSALAATLEGDLGEVVALLPDVPVPGEGPIAVRAQDVRGQTNIDTQAVERAAGAVFVERGYAVDLADPADECRIVATTDAGTISWFVGWRHCTPERGFGPRRPSNRPFQQPGTMGPQLARTIVNLAGVDDGSVFLDPMCGPGALLIEAALVGGRPVGMDAQARMVTGAGRNVVAFADVEVDLVRGSASVIPVRSVDAVAFDAPYGRQSPIAHDSARGLIDATLEELVGLVDRCVAVFDEPIESLARRHGWRVDDRFDRRVHRSLTRVVSVLTRDDGSDR